MWQTKLETASGNTLMGSLETLAHGETDGNIYRCQQKQYGLPTSQVRIPERFGRMTTPKFTIRDNHRRFGRVSTPKFTIRDNHRRFGRMSTPKFTIRDNHRRLVQRRHTRCKVGRLQDILTRKN